MWHHRMWVTGMLKSGFRTIQVSPKDCPAALRQTDHEVDRPRWPRQSGRKLDVKHKAAGVHTVSRQRGRDVAARA
jgi:hypothetical protein